MDSPAIILSAQITRLNGDMVALSVTRYGVGIRTLTNGGSVMLTSDQARALARMLNISAATLDRAHEEDRRESR